MPLLTALDLGKSFGPDDIFSNLSLSIPHRARIALVGANGIGKTTLLRILVGLEEPSTGKIQRAKGIRIGYLPQEAQFVNSDGSLWDECLTAFTHLLELQQELTQLEAQMSNPEQAEAALAKYGPRQQAFERSGGYTYEQRIRLTLTGLGFGPIDFHRPILQLSGGQRTRAYLARLLLSDPDLLLLDEPTNHLDIQAVEWLEAYLKEWKGAVLLVSHDRYFLDQVASIIWEMTPTLEIYHGNYSAYVAQRTERYSRRLEEYQKQQEFIEKEGEYIRRNIAGQNTRQAQGRRKRLESLLDEARLIPPIEPRRLHLNLQTSPRSGNLVLKTYQLEVGYHDEGNCLFSVPDLVLVRGECAAIIGPNGAGKTTFLKTILEEIPTYSGEVILGASLKVGYFTQAHEELVATNNLMEEINSIAPNLRQGEIRDYLAKFLFTGDDVYKQVTVLSGGERGRLALAKLALNGSNLLLLDEPTNHLDLPAQEVLQTVMGDYTGTILLVSHDRYLIDVLATQIWEVNPELAKLNVFQGSYSEYKASQQTELENKNPATVETQTYKAAPRVKQNPNRGVTNRERNLQKRLQEVENEISILESQSTTVSRQLENPPTDPGKVLHLGQEYVRLQNLLEERLEEWTSLNEAL
jgi:ATP-binding cassette, subfamily F, member 3